LERIRSFKLRRSSSRDEGFFLFFAWYRSFLKLHGEHASGLRDVGSGTTEEKNVWFGLVDRVVNPATALLNSNASPLRLGHQSILRYELGNLSGQYDVSVMTNSDGQ
jgi:hypothetical protein